MGEVQKLPAAPAGKGEIIEQVIVRGDLANLKPEERAQLYVRVCESVGLNPMTQPFEYITLNGKLRLYARRDATDQLRKMHGVSIIEMKEAREGDLIVVTVQVRDNTGRLDMAKGAVSLKGLQGADLANAIMKAETKAKRRATLSICGLGFLDESEIDGGPQKRLPKKNAKDIYQRMQVEVDACPDRASLDVWQEENKDRIALLPQDWEDILTMRIQERALDLARGKHTDRVQQAGILCGEVSFQKYLAVADEAGAVQVVYDRCRIGSRRELAENQEAIALWDDLVADYRAWQREPEIVPPRQQKADRAGNGEGAPVVGPTPAGAPELSIEDEAREAAKHGEPVFNTFWKRLNPTQREKVQAMSAELRQLMNEAAQ
jgi:hypothetical protein